MYCCRRRHAHASVTKGPGFPTNVRRSLASVMPTVARSLVTIATALMGAADGLMVGQAPRPATEHACTASSRPETLGRRAVASLLGGAMGAALMRPPSAYADTQAMLDEPMEKFTADEERRAVFLKKQKVFKKNWRKELANLEFASNDEEAATAINALGRLIQANGNEIPEGVRKQDMDQVYKQVQGRLAKDTRMQFKALDAVVQKIVTVKSMGVGESCASPPDIHAACADSNGGSIRSLAQISTRRRRVHAARTCDRAGGDVLAMAAAMGPMRHTCRANKHWRKVSFLLRLSACSRG